MNQFIETPTALPEEEELNDQSNQEKNGCWYYIKIPTIENTEKTSLIGMIDASGSMENYWSSLVQKWNHFIKIIQFESVYTLTFSDSPVIRCPELQDNIYYHGGFQTNISKSFIGLKRLLLSDKPKFKNITIIFISDGVEECKDTSLHQEIQQLDFESLHQFNIQFICIGIGKQFPAIFAIKMREVFNQQNKYIPLFIELNTENHQQFNHDVSQLFLNKLPNYLIPRVQGLSETMIYQYPWDDEGSNVVFSNTIVFSRKSEITVKFNMKNYYLEGQKVLDLSQCIQLSKAWVWQLKIMSSISNQSSQARKALKTLEQLSNQKNVKLSVWERMQLNKNKNNQKLCYNMEQIKKIYMNHLLSNLSEKEQQQRSDIHTFEHKRHSQIVQMAGISGDEFLEAKEEFIQLLLKNNLMNQSTQECSIVSMQNTVDVLKEQDIIQALQECQNQYELVQNFPIIGYGLQIKRFASTAFSEYSIKVISMARHHKTIDSISLLQKEYEIHLQTGDGDVEIINCILPLFDNESQLQPYISSKLYNMLLSFNITQNIDTFLNESYLSLLASSLVYLLGQPRSDWQNSLLRQIKCTFEMLHEQDGEISNIKRELLQNPRECFLTVNIEKQVQCQNPSKMLLIAYCNDIINLQIIECLIVEQLGRSLNRDLMLFEYFTFSEPDNIELELLKINVEINCEKMIQTFYSFSELNIEVVHAFDDKLLQLLKTQELGPPQLMVSIIEEQLQSTNLELCLMRKILKYFCNIELSNTQLIRMFYHAYCNARSTSRNRSDINYNEESILDEIRFSKYKPYIKQQKVEKLNNLKLLYQKEMEKFHKIQRPLTIMQKRFMPNLQLHTGIGIVVNACMSPTCPHYLEIRNDYEKHVSSNSSCFLPNSIYEVIFYYRRRTVQEIFDKLSQNLGCRKVFFSQLLKDPVIVYLKIRDAQQLYNTYF